MPSSTAKLNIAQSIAIIVQPPEVLIDLRSCERRKTPVRDCTAHGIHVPHVKAARLPEYYTTLPVLRVDVFTA